MDAAPHRWTSRVPAAAAPASDCLSRAASGGQPVRPTRSTPRNHAHDRHPAPDLGGPVILGIFELPLGGRLRLRFTRTVACGRTPAAAADDAGASFPSGRSRLTLLPRSARAGIARGAVVRLERTAVPPARADPLRAGTRQLTSSGRTKPVARVPRVVEPGWGPGDVNRGAHRLPVTRLRPRPDRVGGRHHSRLGAAFRWTSTRAPRSGPVAPDGSAARVDLDSTRPDHYWASLSTARQFSPTAIPGRAPYFALSGGRGIPRHLVPVRDRLRRTPEIYETDRSIFVGEVGSCVRRRDSGTALRRLVSAKPREKA